MTTFSHKARASCIGRTQKTAKTECGLTVRTISIAIDNDCTCLACMVNVDTLWVDMRAALDDAKKNNLAGTDDLEKALAAGHATRYHTRYYF
jgi:hypothetical protein